MADLSDIQAALPTKLIGSNSTGLETNAVNSTITGSLFINLRDNSGIESATVTNPLFVTPYTMNTTSLVTTLNVSTTALECKVGATALANRRELTLQAQGLNITYGFTSSSQPFNLANGATVSFSYGPNISIWVRRTLAATVSVVISEVS